MNITIITDVFPWPLSSGGAQGQYNMIDCLRKRHRILLLTVMTHPVSDAAVDELRRQWPEVDIVNYTYRRQLLHPRFVLDKTRRAFNLKFRAGNERFQVNRILQPYGVYFTRDFTSFVNRHVRRHKTDIVEVNFYPSLGIVRYLPDDVRKIFIHHELRYVRNDRILQDYTLTEKEKALKEQVKRQEIADLNLYDRVVTLTATDRMKLREEGITPPVDVSPLAVNTKMLSYQSWNGHLCYVGGYAHIPNKEGMEWFLRQVYPAVSDIPLDIVGKGWPESLTASFPNVRLLGFVPDLADAVRGAIMIIPLLTGSGMRMKILDAAAMSMPFVTTSVGVEGLDFPGGQACVIADTADDFIQGIRRLCADSAAQRRYGEEAHRIYEEKYSALSAARTREKTLSIRT